MFLETLLPQIKRMVGDKGLATLQEVEVLYLFDEQL